MIDDLIRQVALLQRQVDGLIKPETGRWTDISASVGLYQNGAIAFTVTEAIAYVDNTKAHVVVYLNPTAAGTTNNPIYVLLPVFLTPTVAAAGLAWPMGNYTYHDFGAAIYHASANYAGLITGLPAIRGWAHLSGSPIGQTPNFAVAVGDNVGINLTYKLK